MIDVDRTMRD